MTFEKANPDYEGCDACVHSDDSEEICVFRRCIHAVSQLKECYVPKVTQPEIIYCRECSNAMNDEIFGGLWCKGKLVTNYHYCGYGKRKENQ